MCARLVARGGCAWGGWARGPQGSGREREHIPSCTCVMCARGMWMWDGFIFLCGRRPGPGRTRTTPAAAFREPVPVHRSETALMANGWWWRPSGGKHLHDARGATTCGVGRWSDSGPGRTRDAGHAAGRGGERPGLRETRFYQKATARATRSRRFGISAGALGNEEVDVDVWAPMFRLQHHLHNLGAQLATSIHGAPRETWESTSRPLVGIGGRTSGGSNSKMIRRAPVGAAGKTRL
eukprot:scaffold2543_cov152-Isochrysis_galbana.AAC.1